MNGYYSQLHLLEDSLIQEKVRSIELDRNKKFFETWQKESESTLIFLQENGKAITTDGTKLRVDMPSKLLLDLRNGYNIGKLVSLDYNQKKKDGYLVAIPPMIVEAFPNKIINIHPSLIPSFCGVGYYGLHVHEAALKRGVKVTGATVHFVDTGTDTGPIILQKAVKIEPDDTPQSLQRSVMEKAEWKILPKAINLIANGKISVEDHIVTISD